MHFACVAYLAVFAIVIDTVFVGVKSFEESMDSSQEHIIRNKRTLGVNEEFKKEVEIKKKDGTSIKISNSITYNDGGALTMLPAVIDSATNNRIRLLNQIQNGHGRPGLANSMINPPSSGTDSFDDGVGASNFSANTESHQTIDSASANVDSTKHIDIGNIFSHSTSTVASISVEGGSVIDSDVTAESHVGGGSTHVSVSNGVTAPIVSKPTVVSPIHSKPVVVNPIITGGVCCGPSTVPINVVAVNNGHSHGLGLLQKHLEKSVEYYRRKQAHRQHLLDKVAAKQQQISVGAAAVPVHHVHTPDCSHLNPVVDHQSKLQGLKELIAYRHEMKTQRHRNKIAAIHAKLAQHGHHAQNCPACCCN